MNNQLFIILVDITCWLVCCLTAFLSRELKAFAASTASAGTRSWLEA